MTDGHFLLEPTWSKQVSKMQALLILETAKHIREGNPQVRKITLNFKAKGQNCRIAGASDRFDHYSPSGSPRTQPLLFPELASSTAFSCSHWAVNAFALRDTVWHCLFWQWGRCPGRTKAQLKSQGYGCFLTFYLGISDLQKQFDSIDRCCILFTQLPLLLILYNRGTFVNLTLVQY